MTLKSGIFEEEGADELERAALDASGDANGARIDLMTPEEMTGEYRLIRRNGEGMWLTKSNHPERKGIVPPGKPVSYKIGERDAAAYIQFVKFEGSEGLLFYGLNVDVIYYTRTYRSQSPSI